MTRIDIMNCNDITKLKKLCIEQRKQLSMISEILVDESKWHIEAGEAVRKIRDYLTEHQYDLRL